jgi:hypothetical protein
VDQGHEGLADGCVAVHAYPRTGGLSFITLPVSQSTKFEFALN